MESKVTIRVNGKKVVINKFIHEITANVVRGLVTPLHDVDPEGSIEIKIEPLKKGPGKEMGPRKSDTRGTD